MMKKENRAKWNHHRIQTDAAPCFAIWMAAFTLALFFRFPDTACAAEKQFEIDAVHSSLTFRLRYLYTMFTGRFNSFSGIITGDLDKPSTLKVKAEVRVTSVDTANEGRDTHLRSADYFHAELHPLATFESTRAVAAENNTVAITGNFTLHGVTKEVTFTGQMLGHGDDLQDGHRAGFHAIATIHRSDFGIGSNTKLPSGMTALGDDVELNLDILAVEVKPKPKAEEKKTQD